MNRKQYNSRNNLGEVLVFQKSGSTSTFNPLITFSGSALKRPIWKLNNGINEVLSAATFLNYNGFASDTNIREIELRSDSFTNIKTFVSQADNLYGNIDLTPLKSFSNAFASPPGPPGPLFNFSSNPLLTGVTNFNTSQDIYSYSVNQTGIYNLDLTTFSGNIHNFVAYLCPNLSAITHNTIQSVTGNYEVFGSNLTGNLNLPFSGLGGTFQVYLNPNLTGITHVPSSQIFTNYLAYNCNLTGNLNLPLSGLGGEFYVQNNLYLTGITHVPSPQNFRSYYASYCNLTGTLDLSPLTNLGYIPIDDASAVINLQFNPNLTNIIFPNSTQFFRNGGISESSSAFSIDFCDLGYVDFKPLSGATLVSGATVGIPRIILRDNNMTASEVNHILVDFSGNATHNPTGWSNIDLNIGGTNAAPDSASGGYNGLTAISFLTGSPRNWTITHT
jgi:hypothetical protein